MTHVFISYSSKDEKYAQKLAGEMKRRGIETWMDDRIEHGDEWPQVLQKSLERCLVVVVIMSNNSSQSSWVQRELAFAQRKGKEIMPVLLEGENWFPLETTQFADVRGGKLPDEDYFATLQKRITKSLPKPIPVPDPEVTDSRALIFTDEQSLRNQIVLHLEKVVRNKQRQVQTIGLFNITYFMSEEKGIRTHYFSSKIGDEELLRRYDPQVYSDYKSGLEEIERVAGPSGKSYLNISRALPESELYYRLNLIITSSQFSSIPVIEGIENFATALIEKHKDHHIPISEIRIKSVK